MQTFVNALKLTTTPALPPRTQPPPRPSLHAPIVISSFQKCARGYTVPSVSQIEECLLRKYFFTQNIRFQKQGTLSEGGG
jgi:hypothetical protein